MFSDDLRAKAAAVLYAGHPLLGSPEGIATLAASPLVDWFLKFLQSILSGGMCPTPKAKVEFAQRRPFITGLRVNRAAINVTDDPDEQRQLVDGTFAMLALPSAIADAESLMTPVASSNKKA